MPIYEYKCEHCGAEIDLVQSFSAPPPESCAECGKGPMQKLISQSSFILKGGGWYKDGYTGTSNQTGTSASTSPASNDSKPTGSDSKPTGSDSGNKSTGSDSGSKSTSSAS